MVQDILKFFALLAIFASVVLFLQTVINAAMSSRAERNAVNRRLRLMKKGMEREAIADLLRPDRHMGRGAGSSLVTGYYRMVGRAMLGISPQQMLVGMAAATAVILGLLVLAAISMGKQVTGGTLLLLPTVALAAGFGLPMLFVSQRAHKRSKLMEEQFPVAIDIFTRALRSGHPVASAIELLTTEMTDPMGSEFGIVADEISYGLDLNESLANLARRWDLEDLQMFAVCISVQSETGGNLAEILTNLSSVIRDRASLYLKVRALSSEGRMSAWVLSLLPVMTFLFLFSINPGFYLDVAEDPIFTSTFIGLLGMYAIGMLWIRNMVNLKV